MKQPKQATKKSSKSASAASGDPDEPTQADNMTKVKIPAFKPKNPNIAAIEMESAGGGAPTIKELVEKINEVVDRLNKPPQNNPPENNRPMVEPSPTKPVVEVHVHIHEPHDTR